MKVLVDTSIWSLALRKNSKPDNKVVKELNELIHDLRVVIIGPMRQEVWAGISDSHKYNLLKDTLRFFEDAPIKTDHYELAAQLFNQCRTKGIQGSHIDFLICSVSIKDNLTIFTLDNDFENYKKHIDIKLYTPGNS